MRKVFFGLVMFTCLFASDSLYFSSGEIASREEISKRTKQPTPQRVGDTGGQRNLPHEAISSKNNNSGNCRLSEQEKEPVNFGMMQFDVPKGWRYADISKYPKSVQVVVVGKGRSAFPPQLNLNAEHYSGTLQQYLQIVQKCNESQKTEWKDLGTIETQAGQASLSQADMPSEWGVVRMMHVILLKDEVIYILNASALKDEFALYYGDFFQSMRSLRYTNAPKSLKSVE